MHGNLNVKLVESFCNWKKYPLYSTVYIYQAK